LRYVIDASVATKWLLPEVDSPTALAVLDGAQTDRLSLVAPSLIGLEFGHVLGKELRRGRCDSPTADRLWSAFRALPISLVSARRLQDRAFLLSVTQRITIYDSLYLAVAEAEDAPLITADAGLIAAVAASGLRVVHMGAVGG
jgi:predicted nucleic acid-binding protein